jgi:hypothetical protein
VWMRGERRREEERGEEERHDVLYPMHAVTLPGVGTLLPLVVLVLVVVGVLLRVVVVAAASEVECLSPVLSCPLL